MELPVSEIEITRHNVRLPGLPDQLVGATITQVSDLHRGCGDADRLIKNAVDLANSLESDYIFVTGDFVDAHSRDITPVVEMVSCLQAKRGVFACLGNHDHRGDPVRLANELREAGIEILVNSAMQLSPGFWIAGVDDLYEGNPDLSAALKPIPAEAAAILLSHNPCAIDLVSDQDPLLILSGHTHAGQFNFRFFPASWICWLHLRTRYVEGWHRRGKVQLYVNRGIGVTGCWPMNRRINCPPEITLFTLFPWEEGTL